MNILPNHHKTTAPQLNGRIKTANAQDAALLKENIMAYTSAMDQLDMSRLNYVLNTKNSFADENFTAKDVKIALAKDSLEPQFSRSPLFRGNGPKSKRTDPSPLR